MASRIVVEKYQGQQFGLWTILDSAGKNKYGKTTLLCKCKCGTSKFVLANDILHGRSSNCGCVRNKKTSDLKRSHEKRSTGAYASWAAMHTRCTNKKQQGWQAYGGRGISVAKEWASFEKFFEDMGDRPDGCSIGRIDNNLGYSPGNCRWESRLEQANNTRANRQISASGFTYTIAQWSRVSGIKLSTIRKRLQLGWPENHAVTIKPRVMRCV